jgi:N-acetyl sugar amidotransferase
MNRRYQVCARCVMDTSAAEIRFDEAGVCNFCTDFLAAYHTAAVDEHAQLRAREAFHDRVRANGQGKPYDCIVGLSGGVDSSYALHLAVQHGMRPLAVHLDNGWNSEFAQNNIANLVRRLKVDLHTHVIDWPENRDMQRALIKAGVIDVEMIMDNAQAATNYRQAAKYGLKDILSGTNTSTEGMGVSANWAHYKFDKKNIRAIQARFGTMKIRTHPLMSTLDWLYFQYVRNIVWHKYLDYFTYVKAGAVEILVKEYGYVPYRYKHGESVFTKFYQNYILPLKFGVDKRRPHYSNAICTGQMTREAALAELAHNAYIESPEAADDKKYVMKKLGMTEEEFDAYVVSPPTSHDTFASELPLLKGLLRLNRALRGSK